MTTVRRWTGHEARALRLALRFSVRGFAEHLGVAVRTVSKWEAGGSGSVPRPDTQAILDTALSRATEPAQERFRLLCGPTAASTTTSPDGPPEEDHESWADDLDRAAVALGHQDFRSAIRLTERWLARCPPPGSDERSRHLRARSLVLLGATRRDQGLLTGPGSAEAAFESAVAIYSTLDSPRRVAQAALALNVITEMSGRAAEASWRYEAFAADQRLRESDRALALAWAGRAYSRQSDDRCRSRAIALLTRAGREFERLDEPGYWAFAQQKLALAHRSCGDLGRAARAIGSVLEHGPTGSPMQRVRLLAAHGHILASDTGSRDEGMRLLDRAHELAELHELGHQRDSISAVQRSIADHRSVFRRL